MLRLFLLAATGFLLSACAMLSSPKQQLVRSEPAPETTSRKTAPLQSVSFRPPVRGNTIAPPVGLAPCSAESFPKANCWRKGDSHIVYPDAPPALTEINPTNPPPPSVD